ncbi:MAG: hypothetical protein Q8941_12285 [Bacteroidota bacterium]|nr:hypothetical protein [Bacteroidota bacterium]
MNPLAWIYQFITDKKKKISHRFAVIIIIMTGTILLDNILGLSFHYRITNKISEIQQVNSIIQNPMSDSITKNYAFYLRDKIINRKSIADYLSFRELFKSSAKPKINKPSDKPNKTDSNIKNNLIFTLTAGGFFILFGIVIFIAVLFAETEPKDMKFYERLALGIILGGGCVTIAIFLSFLLGLIPLIMKNWTYNYILNGLVQLTIISSVTYSIKISADKNKKS